MTGSVSNHGRLDGERMGGGGDKDVRNLMRHSSLAAA